MSGLGWDKTTAITITIEWAELSRYGDSQLAMLWQVAQANPAPHGDQAAGEIAEKIGREIIRRFVANAGTELWKHQGRDHYWSELCRLAVFKDGEWVPREDDEPSAEDLASVAELDVPGARA